MKRILPLLTALILTLATFSAALAEVATPSGIAYDAIGEVIDACIAEREAGLASCAVSVFNAEETIFTRYYGHTDTENGVAASEETVCEWGSNSKLLVWVSVMQLWERGLIDLEADIRDYLPESSPSASSVWPRCL